MRKGPDVEVVVSECEDWIRRRSKFGLLSPQSISSQFELNHEGVIIFLATRSLFVVVIIWSPGNRKSPSAVIKIRQPTIVQRWNFSFLSAGGKIG